MTYTVTVTLGDWSQTWTEGQAPTGAEPGLVMDNLRASWDSDVNLFPSQPSATTWTLDLFVPAIAAAGAPVPYQGQPVSVVVQGPNPVMPFGTVPPFLALYGRVSDVEATPRREGLTFALTCVDYRGDMGEERLAPGSFPVAVQTWDERWNVVEALSALDIRPVPVRAGWSRTVMQTVAEVEPATTWDLLTAIAADGLHIATNGLMSAWNGPLSLNFWRRHPNERWEKPVVTQSWDLVTKRPYFGAAFVTKGLKTVGALPYLIADAGGVPMLTLRDLTGGGYNYEMVHLDGARVERGVRWRQDKAQHTNRVRMTGELEGGGGVFVQETSAEHWQAVALRGPVEASRETGVASTLHAYRLAMMHLGDLERTVPRYTFDQVTARIDTATDDAYWPRLFDPIAFAYDAADPSPIAHPALGRLVVVTNINPAWNLGPDDYAGRLVGAELTLADGVLAVTARVTSHLPRPNGWSGVGTHYPGVTLGDMQGVTVGNPTLGETPFTLGELALASDV